MFRHFVSTENWHVTTIVGTHSQMSSLRQENKCGVCDLFSCVSGVWAKAAAAAVERRLKLRLTLLLATEEQETV